MTTITAAPPITSYLDTYRACMTMSYREIVSFAWVCARYGDDLTICDRNRTMYREMHRAASDVRRDGTYVLY